MFDVDEVRISVDPPPKSDSDSNNNDNEIRVDDDSVRSNLPHPNFLYTLMALMIAVNFSPRHPNRKK